MSKMSNVSDEFKLSDEQKKSLMTEMRTVLQDAGWSPADYALDIIINGWAKRKGRLINMFSTHPNWNAEKFQIQFSQDFTREIDFRALCKVFEWAETEYRKMLSDNQVKIAGMTYQEVQNSSQKIAVIRQAESSIRNHLGEDAQIVINGRQNRYYEKEYARIDKIQDKFRTNDIYIIDSPYFAGISSFAISKEQYEALDNLLKFMKKIRDYFSNESNNLCPAYLCNEINTLFPGTARENQKISKIIAKVLKLYKLDTIKEIKKVVHNGVEQDKDFGWQMKQAELGDAINPLKYTRHTIISLNPIDYLTMSYGYNWASCHCIKRGGSHGYNGEYCGGTISYMNDPSSFIFYTVDKDYDGNEFELQDKMQRAVFACGEDKLYQGRVYPDGRDNGDQGLAAQFRNVVQKVIADCLGTNNLWTLKKGTESCKEMLHSLGGLAYEDWRYCEDSSMSFLKGENGELNTNEFGINAEATCIETGDINCNNESLTCYEGITCERCGRSINEDEAVYIDGYYYCDDECAANDGWYYCEDIDDYRREGDCYYDDYTGEYFTLTDDMVEVDGYCFSCSDNATCYGFVYVDNLGEWMRERNAYTDDYTGEYFGWDDDCIRTEDGNVYLNSDNAERDGYVENEDGEWVKAEEMEEAS